MEYQKSCCDYFARFALSAVLVMCGLSLVSGCANPETESTPVAAVEPSQVLSASMSGNEVRVFTQAIRDFIRSPDAAPDAPPEVIRPEPLGEFLLTYYWMAEEGTRSEDPELQLFTRSCAPLVRVDAEFADRLALEGTGRLNDGRTLNVSGECECGGFSPCFFIVGRNKRWGVGVEARPLAPYRSVAVDRDTVPIGTVL